MADHPWWSAVAGAVLMPLVALLVTGLDGRADAAWCAVLGAMFGMFAGWSERWRQTHYTLR